MVGLTAYRLNRKCENRQNRECENTALKLQEIPFQRLKNSKSFKKTQTFPGVAFPKPPHVHCLNVCSCFNEKICQYVINITLTSKYNDGNSCSSRVMHV